MSENHNKVVYLHRKATDNTIFYVGIGSESRAYNFEARNPFWKNTYNKYGVVVQIVARWLTPTQAAAIEIAMIEMLGRRTKGTGELTNLTAGGEIGADANKPVRERKTVSKLLERKKKPRSEMRPRGICDTKMRIMSTLKAQNRHKMPWTDLGRRFGMHEAKARRAVKWWNEYGSKQ